MPELHGMVTANDSRVLSGLGAALFEPGWRHGG